MQRATSSKLLDVFGHFSTPAFLLANESNHILLFPVLDAINAILEYQRTGESSKVLWIGRFVCCSKSVCANTTSKKINASSNY